MNAKEITVPIDKVRVWGTNLKVRATSKAGYERTKNQILNLGVYKRLICYKENGGYYVLGGRTRYHVLKEIGVKEIDVAVVEARTDSKKMEYCLSDNDHSGDWLEMELLETTYPLKDQIKLEDFNVNLSPPTQLTGMIKGVGPEDEKEPSERHMYECPKCGHKW